MKNKEILLHTDTVLREIPSARKQGLRYALFIAAISLVSQLVNLVADYLAASTGGLAGIGTRSAIVAVQSVVTYAVMLVTPFLTWGHCAVALQTSQKCDSDKNTLLQGLARFGPILRVSIFRILITVGLMIVSEQIATIIFAFLPSSAETIQLMQSVAIDANALMEPEAMTKIMQQIWPLMLLFAGIYILLLIIAFYHLRLAEWFVLNGENRALRAISCSYHTMRGNCLQLLRLDLWQWEYYLLMGVAGVIAYGDQLLGIQVQWGYWVFYLLSLLMQTGVTAAFLPRVHTAYATFYLDKIQQSEKQCLEMERFSPEMES